MLIPYQGPKDHSIKASAQILGSYMNEAHEVYFLEFRSLTTIYFNMKLMKDYKISISK
jgi:hypothetical protein